MQEGMLADQGRAFESTFTRDDTSNELTVTKCPYNEVLGAEGKPHLLAVCCCSQDASWCVFELVFGQSFGSVGCS
jgi:hypothetical protein